MSELSHPSQMNNKDKFKALLKQVAVSAAMNAVPGTVQFIAEVGHKAYELWLASPPEERESFRAGAGELSEAERDLATAELARETGVGERAVVDVMVQSLQGMRGVGDDEALRSINATLSRATNGQATLTPQRPMLRRSAVGTLLGASQRSVEVSGRHDWPQVEGFEISGVLGKGAAGVVYLAKQTSAGGRVCALKVGDLVSASRFQRKVAAMGAVDHENLIDLWGSGELSEPPPRYWIAMPNVGGLTLADMWRQGELNLPEKLRLMGEVLSGLIALHRAGLAHRDLKPANALVTPTLSVRLADFGLSKESVKAGEATMTATSMGLEGTPAYMSPEQVNEVRDAGAEVDVWAFGVMLYEILKGERPFQGGNLMVLGGQILNQPLSFDEDWAPEELRPVLRKSLTRDKSERYANAIQMERPYREGAGVIIARFAHNELCDAWQTLERDQVLLSVSAVDDLGASHAELLGAERDRLSLGLREIEQWRGGIAQLQAQLTQAEQGLSDRELAQMQRSVEVAHTALATSGGVQAQWEAWHRGLCELERAEQSARASVSALQLQARCEESLSQSLHQSITAWGRADYSSRDQAERSAQAKLRDLRAELNRRVEQAQSRVEEVGTDRMREFEAQRAAGRGEGESAGRAWVSELERAEGADQVSQRERESQARAQLESRISAWRGLTQRDVDHDRAGSAWRRALSDGSLVTFCLERALSLPEDPTQSLPSLSAVSPRRLGEVLASGLRASIDAALREARSDAQGRVSARARAELNQVVSARLDLGEGVARLQRAGYAVGFGEGFSGVVRGLPAETSGWRDQDRRAVDQALRAELRADLVAHEEVIAARNAARRKRLGVIGAIVLAVALIVGGMAVKAEFDRQEAVARAERERQEAVARAERERQEAVARAERERQEAVARAERERQEAAARAERERQDTKLVKCLKRGGGHTCKDSKSGLKWVMIQGGSFDMGSNNGSSDEQPVHRVTLKSFMMSKSEVTVAQYRRCVNASVCSAPDTGGSCNWDKSDREDHPINCVSWFQLNEFAQWVGGRLPSEAEWEYAARSRGKNVTYPWGNQEATCRYAVMSDGGGGCGKARTWPVCSKTSGNTEQGLCDMAGNVWEWTLDEYENSYNGAPTNGDARCNASDCSQNASKSAHRVLRGGSWGNAYASYLRAANRGVIDPSNRIDRYGGRVLRSVR